MEKGRRLVLKKPFEVMYFRKIRCSKENQALFE